MRYFTSVLTVSALMFLPACGVKSSTKATNEKTNAVQPASGNGCAATNRDLAISWDARTGTAAESFNIYGQASVSAAEVQIQQIKANAAGFNPAKPSALLHLTDTVFAPYLGKTICLSVTAVVGGSESKQSNLSCIPL